MLQIENITQFQNSMVSDVRNLSNESMLNKFQFVVNVSSTCKTRLLFRPDSNIVYIDQSHRRCYMI